MRLDRRTLLRAAVSAGALGAAWPLMRGPGEAYAAAAALGATWDAAPFTLGVASGDPLPTSVLLWTTAGARPPRRGPAAARHRAGGLGGGHRRHDEHGRRRRVGRGVGDLLGHSVHVSRRRAAARPPVLVPLRRARQDQPRRPHQDGADRVREPGPLRVAELPGLPCRRIPRHARPGRRQRPGLRGPPRRLHLRGIPSSAPRTPWPTTASCTRCTRATRCCATCTRRTRSTSRGTTTTSSTTTRARAAPRRSSPGVPRPTRAGTSTAAAPRGLLGG